MTISKRAQQFQDILDQKKINMIVQELPDSTRIADDAAQALGCTKAQIVKSLIFRTNSDIPVLVLASGPNRVNEKTIAKLLGEKIFKADANYVKEVTGFSIGGIPPLGHKQEIKMFVDEDLLQFSEVWAAAGTPNAVFKITDCLSNILPAHQVISIK